MAATDAASVARIEIVTERRPPYSMAFRARMVEASLMADARVSDLALQHGVHVSLIYRWRRMARPQDKAELPEPSKPVKRSGAIKTITVNPPATFIPMGVLGHPDHQMPPTGGNVVPPRDTSPCDQGGRPGVIEIDMADGTRLRLDGAVDEHAFRRVWGVLKAAS